MPASNPSPPVLHAVLVALIGATLFPTGADAAEPPALDSYRSAFEGYRAFDAAYEHVNWRQANDAVSNSPHEMHSTDSSEGDRSGYQGTDASHETRPPEADTSPPADPHAGHRE